MRIPFAPALYFVLALPFLPGCSLLYKNSYRGSRFLLYSDHEPEFLEQAGQMVEQIFNGYSELFEIEPKRLGTATFLFKGDSSEPQVVDYGYSPSLLGYYMPFLKLISVDTTPAWAREPEMLRQILLHEIAHHFVITEHPGASSECWLNEGIAGNLEMTLFDEEHFEYPLVNPSLLLIARRAVLSTDPRPSLPELLDMGWGEFHRTDRKELHYALAWSVVHFLLAKQLPAEMPLGRRIRSLYRMDRETIKTLGAEWEKFLGGYDLTGELIRLAELDDGESGAQPGGSERLTACWALRQLGSCRGLDSRRALSALLEGFDASWARKRFTSYMAFIRALSTLTEDSRASGIAELASRGRERIREAILDRGEPLVMRHILLAEVSKTLPRQPEWIGLFIDLLDADDGTVRVVAAQGLGRSGIKRTILNPAFWREAEPAVRRSEIREWKEWWSRRAPAPPAPAIGQNAGGSVPASGR